MLGEKIVDCSLLNQIIIGRVEPHIYAFSTNTIPNYLKIGDTYRPVSTRLKEWMEYYPSLKKEFDAEAKINDVYYRDFAIHRFLENEKQRTRLNTKDLPSGVHYSKEFFKDTSTDDIIEAICDIKKDYFNRTQKYQFYSAESLKPKEFVFARTESYELRPNQKEAVDAFIKAINAGHHNLLMYAVMRFGKSFTSMCCATAINAKLVVIVSAKADVLTEWKKTVESHIFFKDYDFITAKKLSLNNHLITDKLDSGRKIVVFITLQDLQGKAIKDKHREIFGREIDLLLVDETHFGARAEKYGEVLKAAINYIGDIKYKKDNDDYVDIDKAEIEIKALKAKTTIHLSGTPYRILMGSEFSKEDIIAFYQFTDIANDQKAWDKEHLPDDNYKEWDNPYYGFPQMVRFAFVPNESSRKRLESLKKSGTTYAFSALFKPISIKKVDDDAHKKFQYENEIMDLFSVIDGSKDDDRLLGFLDYDKIKKGNMCRHIVIVLPYCASCDALEHLLKSNEHNFKNLCDYEIVNISGVDDPNKYQSSDDVKRTIAQLESEGKKTITLTVNRMLTGSTVPEWDTMLFFKDTTSPQEYDQAIFRLQNQYIKTYTDKNGETIKYNMKPQTLLVDFDPNRMFVMQESKSKIYNVNIESGGNSELEKRIRQELQISPIITVNKDKIVEVSATDILEVISNYRNDRGIKEEALDIPVDLNVLNDRLVRSVIEKENEIGSKSGIATAAHKGTKEGEEGSDYDFSHSTNHKETTSDSAGEGLGNADKTKDKEDNLTKKLQSYYAKILFFAFVTNDTVISLSDILDKIESEDNARIAANLGLNIEVLSCLNAKMNKFILSDLDYKIQNLNKLSKADDLDAAERASTAIKKFGKLGEAIINTPSRICSDMVDLLPDELFMNLGQTNAKIIDIAGTAGEYAVALYHKMKALGIDTEVINNSIYTIPKTSFCYELVRKLYDMLGLNIDNIAKEFNAFDLLNIKNGKRIDCDRIKAILTQNKPFSAIKLTDSPLEGENNMIKFDAVVGNPPYTEEVAKQQSLTNGQARRSSIFQYFQTISDKLSQNVVCLIYPGVRWLHRSGKGMADFGLKQINDIHLDTLYFYPNANEVFTEVAIADGITIVYKNKNKKSKGFNYIYHKNGRTYQTFMDNPGKELLTLNPQDHSIIQKVKQFVDDYKLSLISARILPQKLFGIESDFVETNPQKVKKYTTDLKIDFGEKIKLLANDKAGKAGRSTWFVVDRDVIKVNQNYIDEWKVVVSSANAGGQKRSNQLEIIDNHSAFGRSRVALGAFKTEKEAKNFYNYCKTYLIRFMFLMTDEALTSLGKCVPDVLDYTDGNKIIDFEAELNHQLYQKIGLSKSEILYIESVVNTKDNKV